MKKRIKETKSHAELVADLENCGIKGVQLSHDETLRANALALACKYYVETIVKDGNLYREMMRENRVLKPATYMGVIEVAFNFEAYLSGELKKDLAAITEQSKVIADAREKLEQEANKPVPKQE